MTSDMTAQPTTEPTATPLSYQDAGVNIDAGNQLVENIKPIVKKTNRPEVLSGLGGFGALCELPQGYTQPVLVSATDGVGTKLRLAIDLKRHQTIGIDLVAMSVNDLIVQGAEPLFFLDYYATAKLDVAVATDVIAGIAEGCVQAGCALTGGETAEMPGMYHEGDYDLAGFCVGVVEKDQIIDGSKVVVGDALIALGSSGPHSNGYSLIRKVIEVSGADLEQPLETTGADNITHKSLADLLLAPTKIYVSSILALLKECPVHAISHITGGGFTENIPRVLPQGAKALLQQQSWTWPEIFHWLQEKGNIELNEMYRTFNCGVGMIIVLPQDHVAQALSILQQQGENAWLIGEIIEQEENDVAVEIELQPQITAAVSTSRSTQGIRPKKRWWFF